ncbi:hypothetical protein LV161_008859 [Aspergillus fumigatus]|nr:hypothetical protein LV161_008859 [Aspergillus fumigatus]
MPGRRSRSRSSSKSVFVSDDEFGVSDKELRDMVRALDLSERRRGNAKRRDKHPMKIDEFCRLMEEADIRRRSRSVGVWRDRYSGKLGVGQVSRRGRLRRREQRWRRDRYSRQTRREHRRERLLGDRVDWKWLRGYNAQWRRENRRLYKESLESGYGRSREQNAPLDGGSDCLDDDDEMEFVELVGFS